MPVGRSAKLVTALATLQQVSIVEMVSARPICGALRKRFARSSAVVLFLWIYRNEPRHRGLRGLVRYESQRKNGTCAQLAANGICRSYELFDLSLAAGIS